MAETSVWLQGKPTREVIETYGEPYATRAGIRVSSVSNSPCEGCVANDPLIGCRLLKLALDIKDAPTSESKYMRTEILETAVANVYDKNPRIDVVDDFGDQRVPNLRTICCGLGHIAEMTGILPQLSLQLEQKQRYI